MVIKNFDHKRHISSILKIQNLNNKTLKKNADLNEIIIFRILSLIIAF